MRAADLVTAAVLLALGLVVLGDALRLGIGWGTDGPKSGFFPFWLAVLLIGCSFALLVRAWRGVRGRPFISRSGIAPVLKVILPAAGLVVGTAVIGLYVSTAIYLGAYMRLVGGHSRRAVLALGLGVPIAAFLVFERWFLVPMPKGPLERWLGY